ncbi:MAG: hypothetical protein V3V16_11080 [Melioribacteraceae bacterium]
MQKSFKFLAQFMLLFSVVIIGLSSCDEKDPVSPAEEHFEAEGLVLRTSGIKLAEIFRGETSDTLSLLKDILGDHIEVTFYDSEKKEIAPPNDEHIKFAWTVDDPLILGVHQHEGEEGGFEFHLKGLKVGETQIEFFIKHNDHNDYRSGKFPVKVTSK